MSNHERADIPQLTDSRQRPFDLSRASAFHKMKPWERELFREMQVIARSHNLSSMQKLQLLRQLQQEYGDFYQNPPKWSNSPDRK